MALNRSLMELCELAEHWRRDGLTVVATNGCYDLLHPGHTRSLSWARKQGNRLVVALSDDESVRVLKGPSRPVMSLDDRLEVVGALGCVDAVGWFSEPELHSYYAALRPDILVKGGEWTGDVEGQAEVEAAGGRVMLFPRITEYSTTDIIERIGRGDA